MLYYLLYSYFVYVGLILLLGFIIGLLNKLFYFFLGSKKIIVYLTGVIGTPIHELGHMIFCPIFGHKIDEFKLFQIGKSELGYVNHSYNPKNIYHIIGNFFISIGPIILGTSIVIMLYYLLANEAFTYYLNDSINLINNNGNIFLLAQSFILSIINTNSFIDYRFWIFVLLAFQIVLHMKLSKADIKASIGGFILVSIACIIANAILYLVLPNALIYNALNTYLLIFFSIFLLSLAFLLVLNILALIVFLFKKLIIKA